VCVEGSTLVFSVVVLLDVLKVKPAAVSRGAAAAVLQEAVLLPPDHLGGGAATGREQRHTHTLTHTHSHTHTHTHTYRPLGIHSRVTLCSLRANTEVWEPMGRKRCGFLA